MSSDIAVLQHPGGLHGHHRGGFGHGLWAAVGVGGGKLTSADLPGAGVHAKPGGQQPTLASACLAHAHQLHRKGLGLLFFHQQVDPDHIYQIQYRGNGDESVQDQDQDQ